MPQSKHRNYDPRIRAAENLLDALARCEHACEDFHTQTIIGSACLGAVLLLLGGKLIQRKDGTAAVEIVHDGAELLVEMPL